MANGLASLRGYQQDGEIPDVFAKMLAAIRSGASQPQKPPKILPDTLKDEQRAQWMRDLDSMYADTTQINQKGIYDLFRGGELEELLELVSQMAEREAPFTRYGRDKRTGIGEASYVSPHILEEDRPITVEPHSSWRSTAGTYRPVSHDIRLNILPAFAQKYGSTNITGTQEAWEASPEESLRATLLHELGHGIGYPNERGWISRSDELNADNFAAILEAIRDSSPEDTRRDVLDEAQKLYWARANTYKYREPDRDPETGIDDNQFRANLRAGWAGRQQFSGRGGRDDPYVMEPHYIERMKKAQRDQMRPFLRRILLTPMYEGHPLNEPTAEEGLSGKWHRGIRSLRNLWDRVRS